MTSTPNIPAGWYADPAGGPRLRWWDGTAWTEHFQEPYSATAAAAALKAPEGTPAYSVWIWLAVFVPYVSLPLLFTIDFSSMFDLMALRDDRSAVQAQLDLMTSPGLWLSTVVGWLAAGLGVLFSYRDWRWQQAVGIPRPFHWAWSFFGLAGYPVYAIGRSVVAKRRTGHGSAVLWVTIGMIVLTFVVAIGLSVYLFSMIFANLPDYVPS